MSMSVKGEIWTQRQMYTQGRHHMKRQTEIWGDTSTSQGIPKIANKLPEAKGRDLGHMLPHSYRRNQPC